MPFEENLAVVELGLVAWLVGFYLFSHFIIKFKSQVGLKVVCFACF